MKDPWFTFDLFLALLIIVETWVTPTVLLMAGVGVIYGLSLVINVVVNCKWGCHSINGVTIELTYNW